MTAPYIPGLPGVHRGPPLDPHDKVFDSLRMGDIGPTPADATATRPPAIGTTPERVANQFVKGLGEAGLGAADLVATIPAAFNPSLAPAADQAHAFIDRVFRKPMDEFYGNPQTDEEHVANLLGNLTGGSALTAGAEGLTGTVNSIVREAQVAKQGYRLMPSAQNAIMPQGGTLKYIIMRQADNTPVGFIRGALENGGKKFYVDMTSMYENYGGFSGGANKLGARATSQLLRQLQDFHLDLESIAGDRVSGVRQTTLSRLMAKRMQSTLTPEEQKAAEIASQEVTVPVPPTLRQQLFPNFSRVLRGRTSSQLDEEAYLNRLLAPVEANRELDAMYLNPQHLRE